MKDNFAAALKMELTFEGGKVDDPKDPGGRTNEGVTQRVFSAWLANNGKPAADVYAMSDDERDAIYRLQYADKIKFDVLPAGVDAAMLDGAVNSGPRQAVLWCQRALGFTGKDADGVLGETTFAAIQAADPAVLINGICDRRLEFLKALSTFGRFGKGWSARVLQVRTIGLAWSAGVPKEASLIHPEHADAARQRATVADAKKIPAGSPGAGTAGIGTATAAASGALQATKDQVGKLATIPHMADVVAGVQAWLDHGIVLLGFGGFVVAGIGTAWFAWNRSRAASLRDALDLPQPKGA